MARRLRPRAATPRGRPRRPGARRCPRVAARRARRGHPAVVVADRRFEEPRVVYGVHRRELAADPVLGELRARPHRPLSDETTSSGESGRNAHAWTMMSSAIGRVRSARTPSAAAARRRACRGPHLDDAAAQRRFRRPLVDARGDVSGAPKAAAARTLFPSTRIARQRRSGPGERSLGTRRGRRGHRQEDHC